MKILIIDDDDLVIELLTHGLDGTGHEILSAPSGEAAIELAAQRQPDLVITDLMLPGIDGLEVTRRLKRAAEGDAFLPVVVLTARDETSERIGGFAAGCDDYLGKPVSMHELRARVHSLLMRRTQDIELRKANDRLREAQKLKAELAAYVVHDLRNPLSALKGNLDLIGEYLPVAPEIVLDSLADCRVLVDKGLSMVAGLLDVAQLEEGLLQAVRAEVVVGEFLSASARPHEKEAESRRIAIELEVNPADLRARLDEGMLQRAVEGLVDNSVRYARRGGRVVCAARQEEAGGLEILIGNDGPAVPEPDRDKIFDKYFQIEARRRGARNNRGLGLYFCKLAAEAHGGRIAVEERPGLPTCFVLTIPPV